MTTSHVVTSVAILVIGMICALAGAVLENESLTTTGTTMLLIGGSYATGKAVANRMNKNHP
jgi:hypothetical protein